MNKVDRYDLNKITLEDCMKLNEELRISPIISNGEVIGFEKSSGVDICNVTNDIDCDIYSEKAENEKHKNVCM